LEGKNATTNHLDGIARYVEAVVTPSASKPAPKPLPTLARLYLGAVIVAGLSATVYSAADLALRPISAQWLILAALTLLTGSFSVKIPSIAVRISVSEAFVFASVLLFGPSAATVIVALDSFVMSLWLPRDQRFHLRSTFNLAAGALGIWVAASSFYWLSGAQAGNLALLLPLERHLPELAALGGIYFLLNSWLVAIAISFERNTHVFPLWWTHFPWFSLNYFGGVSVAALLVSYTRSIDLSAIGIIVPLLLISYLTYRSSLGRIEDAKRHVDVLNDLYMSTIETLAMAVDAKDQITHGHIRRVQVYAVELAKRLGVSDPAQLKAIETAALLHDMGKLAIPEYILNKPGKLTPAEFDKMKRHADIGADLLSSIKFGYPVVPIVRHHHECWDGRGYPAGIGGADIPLGARILSVVDCFDALNSDRPYRPRLTPEDAFDILRERRGSMYDPLVVDTFIRVYPEIAADAVKAGHEARSILPLGLYDVNDQGDTTTPLDHIRANASESALLTALRRDLTKSASTQHAITTASHCLRHLTAATVFAFFRYSKDIDVLTCEIAVGDREHLLEGLKINLGERVSGWTAATRRTAINSDASLDLSTIASAFDPPLRSTVSAPIVQGDHLIGVLTAYSTKSHGFDAAHRYPVEEVAAALSDVLAALAQPKQSTERIVRFPPQQA
jgi:putative nucleotidyltransferase with HDIG domain